MITCQSFKKDVYFGFSDILVTFQILKNDRLNQILFGSKSIGKGQIQSDFSWVKENFDRQNISGEMFETLKINYSNINASMFQLM